MNLIEAVELLDVVSNFSFKCSNRKPEFRIYDKQKEGCILCIKANSVNSEYRSYIEEIVKSRRLGIQGSDGYLIIYSP